MSIASEALPAELPKELPKELVARFKAALDRLNPDGGRIGLAVSGGPDSMAMLLLAHEVIPGAFEVATVNHGLRPEAADECALVAAACAARGVACAVLHVLVPDGNLQAEARGARYSALSRWAGVRRLQAVSTAHHADDQAETLLMRLNRGSSVAGLAGVREIAWLPEQELVVLRPLLLFRRAELAAIIQLSGVESVQDPSNLDDQYDRVRVRKALSGADWIDVMALSRSASLLAEADDALEVMTEVAVRDRVSRSDDHILFAPTGNREITYRVVRRIIGWLGNSPRGGDVARLVEGLEAGRGSNLGGVLATVEGEEWLFRPEPPRRSG